MVDCPCHELPQAHKGVWGEGGEILVLRGCEGVDGPVLEEHIRSAGPEGLDESGALKEEREGKDGGSRAEAGVAFGGVQAILRAARRLLYL